ncbi:MAG: bifunctional homocysteine S-methyltransferase/methylenetetrahydrofolate reductase, partial [Deltaproteobacteria bacterium]|nr:bifunctional homocysteine S-methyltransferase/methylenetetrahydrofolate reductase [Deltaproteobacteria bacterium]
MSQLTFLDALRKGPLLFDGAMGTMLYERGILYTQSFDAVSLTRPELVRSIHQEYLRAGAQALLTNTFGANRFRLASHQLEGEVRAINQAGLRIAREVAAPHKAWVGASIGPSGVLLRSLGASEINRIGDAFTEQIEALLWPEPPLAPPDFFMLETFRQMGELRIALERARKLIEGLGSEKRPAVVASLSFDGFGTTADGLEPEEVARRLLDWGADAIGVNCADGPAGVYESACRMLEVGLPIVARPNAGLPRRVEGRLAYMATPEYFQLYARRLLKAGILGVGGCCGTTPDHIRQMAASVRMRAASVEEGEGESMAHEKRSFFMAKVEEEKEKVIPLSEKGELGAKLARGDFIVSVEVNPPPGLFLEKAIQAARMLRDGGVDAINVADGARASARMGNFVLCLRIQEQVGLPTLMHVTTRDRNLLGLVAHLLARHELGLHNLVIITGDPPKMGDFPDATPVYDLDSIGLLRLVSHLNRGFDPGGKPLGGATRFLCATGAEPAA